MSVFQGLRTWLIRLLGGTTNESRNNSPVIQDDRSQLTSAPDEAVAQQELTNSTPVPESMSEAAASAHPELNLQEHVDQADQSTSEVRIAKQTSSERTLVRAEDLAPFDEHLLERARMQWHLGDWEGLLQIEREALQTHPERAKLCILYASALLQNGQTDIATRYVQMAREFGCNKKMIAQVLIAGVHNSLGRAATLVGDEVKAQSHFRLAVSSGSPGVDSPLVAEVRARQETQKLTQALAQQAATTVQLAGQADDNFTESDATANDGQNAHSETTGANAA